MGDFIKDSQVLKDRLDKVEEKDIDGAATVQLLKEMLQVVSEIAGRLETLESQIEVLSEK
ncbi:MAG: hypothetical protein M8353_02950 [ANME-2 cluster archaeon]|nr:hypothetical protein [ANME-2 cluster archaeon]